jgi:DUF971 family protein
MAGLQAGAPTPQSITVHNKSRVLEVGFSDGASFRIPFELMRIYSPSAEVQGHGPGQESCRPASATSACSRSTRWATTPSSRASPTATTAASSRGTCSTSWAQQDELWAEYERRLAEAGVDRDAPWAPRPAMPAAAIERALAASNAKARQAPACGVVCSPPRLPLT